MKNDDPEVTSLTEQINEALNSLGEQDDASRDAVSAGRGLLDSMNDEW